MAERCEKKAKRGGCNCSRLSIHVGIQEKVTTYARIWRSQSVGNVKCHPVLNSFATIDVECKQCTDISYMTIMNLY